MDADPRFEGKAVLITGASTGIGRPTALAFAREGAAVAIGDMNESGAGETVRLIEEGGGRAFCQRTNVAEAREVRALVQATLERFGRLDAAFNNAGVLPPTRPLIETEEAEWNRTIDVDLKGVWLCLKYEIAHMLEAGGGAIARRWPASSPTRTCRPTWPPSTA